MSFYLKPPRGLLNFHSFENCVNQRLNCYDSICNNYVGEIHNFDCLVEDSPLDRTGHYLFRLYAYFSTTFRQIFLKNELRLLLVRLNSYCKNDLKYFLKRLISHSKYCLNENGVHANVKKLYLLFVALCSSMLRQDYLNHIFMDIHEEEECNKFVLKVPFYQCASLIACREVILSKGYVEIQCSQWKKLLVSIYETYLLMTLTEMKYSQNVQLALIDTRIRDVFKAVKTHFFRSGSDMENGTRIKLDINDFDAESKLFPFCMLNLYKVLQKTNRLSHNDRFDFSLYMKDIGVSLDDSLKFWENAYTKQHNACSKCSHSWKDSEKRYIYGIRHLYGLEGSRKNYKVRSCNYFQHTTLSATGDGGCPFKHFDDTNLRMALKKLLPNNDDDVELMIYQRKNNPSTSCKLFYQNIFSIVTDNKSIVTNDLSFTNPVEYYLSLKNMIGQIDNRDSGICCSSTQ